ncbi:unnamed protein product [Oikopleura dioica]|uniref:Uncharacterized protein n=1 Tax=Oikopleura dioica TaxID=34765 RepID=E4WSU8_OIKDI|nr:unnamed protein product [Oikopleura dioica]
MSAKLKMSIIRVLLEKGEDPTIEDKRGNCPLQLFIKWNTISLDMIDDYWRLLRLYLQKLESKHGRKSIDKIYGNGNACLHTAIVFAEQTTVQMLLKSGADINLMNKKHDSALILVTELKSKNPKKYEKISHTVISFLKGKEDVSIRSPRIGRKMIEEEEDFIET